MFLLDTSVFLWLWMRPERLPEKLRAELADNDTRVFLSAASAWEISIKHALGKLELPGDPSVYVPRRVRAANLSELSISLEHALAVGDLPPHHFDPFDRVIVAQAQCEGLTIVTADKAVTKYDVHAVLI